MTGGASVGESSRANGIEVPTIRYYEQIDLVLSPSRNQGNRSLHDAGDCDGAASSGMPAISALRSCRSANSWRWLGSRTFCARAQNRS
jgi:hypothetical protein